MSDNTLLEIFLKKLRKTVFKIYREENPLVGEAYTVMHIESVFDILDLIAEFAAIHGQQKSMNFAIILKYDILKSIGREIENE